MAEVIAVVGSISSFTQVVGNIISTSQAVRDFVHDIREAPDEVRRAGSQLSALEIRLKNLKLFLEGVPGDLGLPSDLSQSFLESSEEVETDLRAALKVLRSFAPSQNGEMSKRARIRYALDKGSIRRVVEHVTASEKSMSALVSTMET